MAEIGQQVGDHAKSLCWPTTSAVYRPCSRMVTLTSRAACRLGQGDQ